MVLIRRKKRWVTTLAYKYFTIEQAVEFDKLYNSKYVWDNRKVSNVAKMLINKYREERLRWQRRRNERRY